MGLPRTNPLESCSRVLVRACAGGGASPVEGVQTWAGAGWGLRREGEEAGVGPGVHVPVWYAGDHLHGDVAACSAIGWRAVAVVDEAEARCRDQSRLSLLL